MDTSKDEFSLHDFQSDQDSSLQESYNAISIPKKNLNIIFSKKTNSKHERFLALKKLADTVGSAEDQFQTGLCYENGALTVSLELIQTCVYDVKHEQANNNTRSSSISRSFSSNIAPLGT